MDELDRVVDELLGTRVADEEEEEEVAVEVEPQVVKQISTLQLHDLEADTPQETIPPPLPPRQDPPLKEEQERFVKNDSCM
ncbi:hypothetical protein HDU99_007068, partial [Rhizoclosmatium hyalinum]